MSRILTIDITRPGSIQGSGDPARVVQRMRDLMRHARQRLMSRD